jgi:phage gp45-like
MDFKFLQPLVRKIKNIIIKSILEEVNDSREIQVLKVTSSEGILTGIQRIQNYGTTSVPPKNSEALILCVSGNKENCISPSVDFSEERPRNLKEGEVFHWSIFGQRIKFLDNGEIEVSTEDGKSISFNGKSKSFVTHDELQSALSNYHNSTFMAHVHLSAVSGSPTATPTEPLSDFNISSSKTNTIFTGG